MANHTNRLVDVVLALRRIDRRATVLAKAPLFRGPLAFFVRAVGALPVHRARDGARNEDAREETARSLDSAARIVAGGGCLLLFPEGVSHDEPGVLPAHSGAARVAFDAAALLESGEPLRIVPLGLLYRDKRRPRSEAATLVGEPIRWDDLVSLRERDERAAVAVLTARIEAALRDVTLHLEEWEDLPLVQAATIIGASLDGGAEAIALADLAEGIARLREHQPRVLADIRERVDMHARRIRRFGVRPDESDHLVVTGAMRHVLAVLASPFVALAGLVTRRRALVDRAARSVRDARVFTRLLVRGRFVHRVTAQQRALVGEVETLLHAARALPPASGAV